MACFIPVKPTKGCSSGWKVKEQLGKGAYGEVHQACCKDVCDYVAKHILESTKLFEREVSVQVLASAHNLAPKIHDVWTCSHGGVIVMDSMKMTLISRLKKCIEDKKPQFIYLLMKQVMECYLKLTQLGICHADTHMENIMVDFTTEKKFYKGDFKVKFIDYGQSFLLDSDSGIIRKNQWHMFWSMDETPISEQKVYKLLSKPIDREQKIEWKEVQKKCMDGYSIYNNFKRDLEPLVKTELDRFFLEYTLLMIHQTIHVSFLEQPFLSHPDWTEKYQLKSVPRLSASYEFSTDKEVSILSDILKTKEEKEEEKEEEKREEKEEEKSEKDREKENENKELEDMFGG